MTLIKRVKTNAYMKKFKKTKNNSESNKDKQIRRAKKRLHMKGYRNKTRKRMRAISKTDTVMPTSADPQSISEK